MEWNLKQAQLQLKKAMTRKAMILRQNFRELEMTVDKTKRTIT